LLNKVICVARLATDVDLRDRAEAERREALGA